MDHVVMMQYVGCNNEMRHHSSCFVVSSLMRKVEKFCLLMRRIGRMWEDCVIGMLCGLFPIVTAFSFSIFVATNSSLWTSDVSSSCFERVSSARCWHLSRRRAWNERLDFDLHFSFLESRVETVFFLRFLRFFFGFSCVDAQEFLSWKTW